MITIQAVLIVALAYGLVLLAVNVLESIHNRRTK